MDTHRTTEVAQELNVPLPRLLRFVAGRDDVVREGNRIRLYPTAVDAALAHFGAIPRVEGLSRVETQTLVALSRRPRGLVSIRQVAKAARLSPTATTRALAKLGGQGLVTRRPTRVFDGEVTTRDIFEVDWTSTAWRVLAPALSTAVLPHAKHTRLGRRLPPRLANVFWTGDWHKVDIEASPRYVAHRILNEGRDNPEALAFLGNLPEEAVAAAVESTLEGQR
jgi:hypothetical protein